jgi:predicted nucleotidyltransferase
VADEATAAVELNLPSSIRRVVELGIRAVNPDRVILYGSRARGDAREDSDYDLAFLFSADRRASWVRFVVDLDDASVTLLPVDLLDWNEASNALRERICREGIVLYERRAGG